MWFTAICEADCFIGGECAGPGFSSLDKIKSAVVLRIIVPFRATQLIFYEAVFANKINLNGSYYILFF